VTKGESLPEGSTLELTKDGKLKIEVKKDGKVALSVEGTYKIEGKNFTVNLKGPGGKDSTETMEIKKLTDTELVTYDMAKQTDTFKKKK
jgi:uncharacterized protein (TIGR03066 family)